MKILSVRRGFVTNSSSDNFWFVVLEKEEDAREDMAKQMERRRRVPMDRVLKAINQSLKKEKYMYDGECEVLGGEPVCIGVDYSIDLKKLAKADDEMVSSLVGNVHEIVERCIKEERPMENTDMDISKFAGIVTSGRESVTKVYRKLCNIAKSLDDDSLLRLVKRINKVSLEGLFRNERCALSKDLVDLIKDAASTKGMKIGITYMAIGQGEAAYETAFELGHGEAYIDRLEKKGGGVIGVCDESLLIMEKDGFLLNRPIFADLKNTSSFAITCARGTSMHLNSLTDFLKKHGLMKHLVDQVARKARKGDSAARIAKILLTAEKDFCLGYSSQRMYEYT